MKPQRIPIKDAKEISENHNYDQVIIVAWNKTNNITSVCTYGKSIEDCDQAAQGGNYVKKALGWPLDKCNDIPSRVKKLQSENKELKLRIRNYENRLSLALKIAKSWKEESIKKSNKP